MHQDPNKSHEDLLKDFESLSIEEITKPIVSLESLDDSSDVVRFVMKTNIKPGSDLVRTSYFFRLFKTYFKNSLDIREFSKLLSNFVVINKNFVKIDKSVFSGPTPEEYLIQKSKKRMSKAKVYDYTKFLDIFLYENKIKSGLQKIPANYLFCVYMKWLKNRINKMPPKKGTFILLKDRLDRKVTKHGVFYMITINDTNEVLFKDEYVKKFQKKSKQDYKKRLKESANNKPKEERALSSAEPQSQSKDQG